MTVLARSSSAIRRASRSTCDRSEPSTSRKKTFPARTSLTARWPRRARAAAIALPWGSRTSARGKTRTSTFTRRKARNPGSGRPRRRWPRSPRAPGLAQAPRAQEGGRCWCGTGASRRLASDAGRPPAARDPLLERPGVRAVAQHVLVVVELEEQRRRVSEELHEVLFNPAEVGGDDGPRPALFESVNDRFVRVVRRRERAEPDVSDPPFAARLDADKRRKEVPFEPDRRGRSRRREDGALPASGEDQGAARVVAVLVRDEDAADRLRLD